MPRSLEFLVGLLESEDLAAVAWEDFQGSHAQALQLWQTMDFLDHEPGKHPVPGCPHCGEGVPYLFGERCLCNRCFSTVDRRHLHLWRLNRETFLCWLASQLQLRGGVRRIDEQLWQLGTWEDGGIVCECFYGHNRPLSDAARNKLAVYRSAVMLYGLCRPKAAEQPQVNCVSLLKILRSQDSLYIVDRTQLLDNRGDVRFDPASGAVTIGGVRHGEVPVGSKEYFLLLCLSQYLDQFVAYADIKHFVQLHAGGKDTTEEATFCHRLKNRIKKNGWVPKIDLLLSTTNKRDGYRLRGQVAGGGEF